MTTIECRSGQGRTRSSEIDALLTADRRERARVDANAWIKSLRLAPYDGRSMRERFTYRGDSLWWFTELYLHKMRRLDTAVEAALALDAAVEAESPASLAVTSSDAVVRHVATAFGAARRLPVDVQGTSRRSERRGWPGYLMGLTAQLSRLRGPAVAPIKLPAVAAFVHTAFWRRDGEDDSVRQEGYIGPTLEAVSARLGAGDLLCVGVGPRRNFRARRWWDPVTPAHDGLPITPIERLAPRSALDASMRLWADRRALAREIVSGAGIRQAGHWNGLDLWPVLGHELERVALVQWPWSARAMDEAAAALARLQPRVVVTYAEAGGWGRALMLEARRLGVRSVGLQHGFIYRHWLNYRHELDEVAPIGDDHGFPAPDLTLVFDGYAARHLRDAGHLPAASIRVTGSPRLDELVARVASFDAEARATTRRELGVRGEAGRLLVLAAKRSELGPSLEALVDVVAARPDVRLAIKTHPAETAEAYASAAARASNVVVVPASSDLTRLLAACDGLATRNSTVAIDALAIDVPSLVVGLPNNLSPFVEAGVMLGADGAAQIAERLDTLLYDLDARRSLAAAARDFRQQHDMRADGRAAERAADAILGVS
jgi:hypothetical protein